MAAEAEVLGTITFEYNPEGDKSSTKLGRQLGVATVGSLGNVTISRRVDDVTYKFRATETTFRNLKGLNGGTLSVSKPFGPITATGGLELGPVRSLNGTLKGKWTYSGKRSLELSALWSERSGATILSLIGQPHANVKVTNSFEQMSTSLYSCRPTITNQQNYVNFVWHQQVGKFVVSPAINWSTTEKGLSVSRKIKGGKLKGSYGFDNHSAGIEYDFKPYKIAITGKTTGKGAGRPKLSLAYNADFELSQVRDTITRKKHAPGGKVDDVRRDIPLDTKLKELDALYQPRLKKAEAKAHA